jgi:hypothetical protein
MNDKKIKLVEEQNEINYFEPEMRAGEEFEEEYKHSFEERNESEEMYMISTILTSDL